jgi:thiosulfate dehydrogenase [quinone] large subunit
MVDSPLQRGFILFFRLAMGWTFLYAGLTQLATPHWTAAGFLASTKTFHDVFVWFASPGILPYTDFLVKWGHTLIGLSLIVGLMVRLSSAFGVLLMAIYYLAHLDFPYVDSQVNFIMEYHLVYGGILIHLIAVHAGRIWGLDSFAENLPFFERHHRLRPLVT